MHTVEFGLIWMLLAVSCDAANIQKLVWYKSPIKHVQGTTADPAGAVIGLVDVNVWTNTKVWLDDSLNFLQKRAKQKRVTATSTDENGRFSIERLPKGSYELEFKKSGFDDFSVIIQVDTSAPSEKFCVKLYPDAGDNRASFQPCKP